MDTSYLEKIRALIANIDPGLADFSGERKRPSPPTQVSSEFLTNKEQGDWAEKTLLDGINAYSQRYIAVRYGRGDSIIAGEPSFLEFFESYQDELDTEGKRPDLLIFDRKDFPYKEADIRNWSPEELETIVTKAKCGIEVRSSAFLINKYEAFMQEKTARLLADIQRVRNMILREPYADILLTKNEQLYQIIQELNIDNYSVLSYRTPSWHSTPQLRHLSAMLKELKGYLNGLKGRNYLSITPKVEDLRVVCNWILRYGVPHYYVQVFFDRAYGISFEKILSMLANPSQEGHCYSIESDIKNQGKTTIKINAVKETNILEKIHLPNHHSQMKELDRGRLLYYVSFEESTCVLNIGGFENLFGFKL
ncbi:MAG: AccI family restriction endonuclease [bacterium]|nr:AccI family restriction endonuclease [bacterium]